MSWRCLLPLATLYASAADDPSVSPSPSPTPRLVYLHAFYNSLSKVDPISKNFHSDFYFDSTWVDDAYANQSAGATYDTATNWMPLIEIINAENGAGSYRAIDWSCYFGAPSFMSKTSLPEGVSLDNNTWVQCTARVVADFTAEMQLQDFPQDIQWAHVDIESFLYTSDQVLFIPCGGFTDLLSSAEMTVDGYSIGELSVKTQPHYSATYLITFSRLVFYVTLARDSSYYIYRFVLNMILLMLMGVALVFLRANEPDRIAGTIGVFSCMVAWEFILIQSVPQIPYQTRLDMFMNLSFGCIFVLAIVFGLIYICFTTEEGENREDDASQKRRRRMREGRPKVYPAKSVAAPASSLSPGSMSPDDMEGAQPRIAPAPQSSDDQTGGAATNLSIERSARLSCRSFAAKLWSMIQRTSPRRKADLCAAFFVLAAYITAVTVIVMRPISKSSPPDYFA